jgi:predicted nuclease with TOPRIM domain
MANEEKTGAVTNELLYEVLKNLQTMQAKTYDRVGRVEAEIISLRKQLHELQGDNIRRDEVMAELSTQVDRINTRLELRDS